MGVTLWVLVFANAAVIVGVIFEEDEKVIKFVELRRKCGWLGAISLLRKRGLRTLREFGFVLLVAGLGVELLAQTVSEVDSNNKLETAMDAIAKLGIASDNLQAYVQSRQDALTNAQKRLDNAIKAAQDKAEALEKRTADRGFTTEQHKAVVDALKAIPKGPVFVIVALADSTDGHALSKKVQDILIEGGFTPGDASKFSVLSFSAPGAFMVVSDLHKPPPQASGIQAAFAKGGLSLPAQSKDANMFPKLGEDEVAIVISSHPQ